MFAVEFKAGDGDTVKNGMISHVYYPELWGHNADYQTYAHFANAGKVYQIILFDDIHRDYFKNGADAYNPTFINSKDFRARKLAIDFDEVAKYVDTKNGYKDYKTKLFSTENVPIIDMRGVAFDKTLFFKDTALIDYTKVKVTDTNAIYGGSHNIGTGQTYTTVTSWWNDWGNLTSHMTGTLTSDTSETASNYLCYSVSHGAYNSTLTSNTDHAGSPVAGWKVQVTSTGHFCSFYETAGSSTIALEKFSLVRTGNASGDGNYLFDIDASVSMGTVTLRKLFIDGRGYTGSGIRTNGTTNLNLQDLVIWDTYTGWQLSSGTGTKKTKNVFITGCINGLDANGASGTITNVASGANTTNFGNIGSATVTYCASSSTLSGGTNQQNLTWTDQFNTDDTQSNFAEPKSAGVCDTSGTDPVDFTTDIAGNDISSVFPIGAKRIPAAAGGSGIKAGTLSLMGVGI